MDEIISLIPSMLFISNEDWHDDKKKDLFLSNLLGILKEINEYKSHKIAWTEQLEEVLWTTPQSSPWLNIHDTRNSLISVIYRYLSSNTVFIETQQPLKVIEPKLELSIENEIIINEYLKMYSNLIDTNSDFSIYCNCINFSYDCIDMVSNNDINFSVNVLSNISNYLSTIDYSMKFWPTSMDDLEISKLITSTEICRKINFQDNRILYNYQFSKNFIKSIITLNTEHRNNFIYKLTKRLCLTCNEAALDAQLQDEFLNQTKEYRFRITPRPSSTRVHYNITGQTLCFLDYYGIGEHDDGL